jgi:alpha-glucosidase
MDISSGPLTLRVFPGPECAGHLYQDDGKSFEYKNGNFLRMTFTCAQNSDRQLTIHVSKHEGRFPAWWQQMVIEVNGFSQRPRSVRIEGKPTTFDFTSHFVTVTVPDNGSGLNIMISP